MKKNVILTFAILLIGAANLFAQQEKGIIGYNNWLNPWTEFQPNKIEYSEPTQILSGNINRDTKLYKRDIYLLLGDVFIVNGATLTIEPGTVIIGDFETKASLTISKGSKIVAEGTSTDPIVFTSSRSVKKPGDWGGIFILGDAPTNKFNGEASINYGLTPTAATSISYGGNNPDSNSGVFSYVRIEYAGKRTKEYGYFNGLTLAGVGQKTMINNVMVSYCEGNSFNVLGGIVSLDRLVSYKSSINDFEFNFGAKSSFTNSLAVKSPYVSGAKASKSINILAYNKKEESDLSKPQTSIIAENLTVLNLSKDLDYDIQVGLVNEAIYVGEHTSFAINNSVISGFSPAVILDNKIKLNEESLARIMFASTYFNNCNGNIFKKGIANNDDLENWYGNRVFNNVYSKGPDSETFINTDSKRRPDFRLRINRIVATND
jgi:hypothetical protein